MPLKIMVQFQMKVLSNLQRIAKNLALLTRQFTFVPPRFVLNRTINHFIMADTSGPDLSEGPSNNPMTSMNLSISTGLLWQVEPVC